MNILKKKFAIIIPAANEEKTIRRFCQTLLKEITRLHIEATIFLITDNASKDKTRKIIEEFAKKDKRIISIFEPKNHNVVDAYVRGYQEALRKGFDYIIEMDCGFSHLPSDLPKFIKGFAEGYDCILGVRPLWSPSYDVPLKRRLFSLGGTILSNFLLGTKYTDMTSGFEGFTRSTAKKIFAKKLLSTGHFFQTEVRYRAKNYNYKEVYITYNFPSPRVNSSSIKNSFSTLFTLAKERISMPRSK